MFAWPLEANHYSRKKSRKLRRSLTRCRPPPLTVSPTVLVPPPMFGGFSHPAMRQGPLLKDRAFRPDIQGLRAVAVLLVVIVHAQLGFLYGGFFGVDVFFVISGFVITGSSR